MLLHLARLLSSSPEGLTIDDMADALGVHRRTAQRFRDALQGLFPQMEETADGKSKRWRIAAGLDGLYQSPTPEEVSSISIAADAFRRQGALASADVLDSLAVKIKSAMRGRALSRIIPDVDALVRSEWIIATPGPRLSEDERLLATVRRAILSMRLVQFTYVGTTRRAGIRRVAPYGLIFGRFTYLVGAEEGTAPPDNWRFDKIADLEICEEVARAPTDFDLQTYANMSFGVFRGDVEDVVLRVSASAPPEAVFWQFHPDQQIEIVDGGGFRVRFRASGMLELAWHLFIWSTHVTVESPDRLRGTLRDEVHRLARHLDGAGPEARP
jgi:predicted DNA-binding transcriptional regulator YafY